MLTSLLTATVFRAGFALAVTVASVCGPFSLIPTSGVAGLASSSKVPDTWLSLRMVRGEKLGGARTAPDASFSGTKTV